MTTEKPPEAGVHRLLDIVVEEVSLVDRAANKHRFLIVKRSEPMDESTTQTTTDQSDTEDVTSETTEDPETEGATEEGNGEPQDEVLALAVEALEHLTGAVEQLSTVAPEDAQARVTELAGALREISNRLAERSTAAGDRLLEDDAPVLYSGVPVQPVPLFPETLGETGDRTAVLLCNPKNIHLGIWRQIRLESARDISEGTLKIVATLRFDVRFAEEPGVAKLINLAV